jgi:hypothetical protein
MMTYMIGKDTIQYVVSQTVWKNKINLHGEWLGIEGSMCREAALQIFLPLSYMFLLAD